MIDEERRARVAVFPELMAGPIRFPKEDHEAIPRPMAEQILGRCRLLADGLQDSLQHQIKPPPIDLLNDGSIDWVPADVPAKFLVKPLWVHPAGVHVGSRSLAREIEAADHLAIDRLGGEGAGEGDRDHRATGIAENFPERHPTSMAAVHELQIVRARPRAKKVKDPVLARVLARHETGPCRKGPRRDG